MNNTILIEKIETKIEFLPHPVMSVSIQVSWKV